LAIELALALDGEIINADAMQLYRGMDIGTAKVTSEEMQGIPHHLLDVLDVLDVASVAAYQRQARALIEEIIARKRVPILVGGSGLYVQAVLDDLRFPGTDPDIRGKLDEQAASLGTAALYERLAKVDPAAAEAILPGNIRRIIRALEVIEITGEPFSANLPKPGPARYDTVMIGVDREVQQLDSRVELRVDQMFASGLIEEVQHLMLAGLAEGKTASRALGYQQVLEAMKPLPGFPREVSAQDVVDVDFSEAKAATMQATRRFVRRQRSWFRRDSRIIWVDGAEPELAEKLTGRFTP